MADNTICQKCGGTGRIAVFDGGTIYETDTAEERAQHWRSKPCPDCSRADSSVSDEIARLRGVVEAQQKALLHWRRSYDLLFQENNELRNDKDRLDYLESKRSRGQIWECHTREQSLTFVVATYNGTCTGRNGDIRSAIDAAMSEEVIPPMVP